MLVKKITTGYVVQVFDTETQRFVSQEFVAGDECRYEDEDRNTIESDQLTVNGEEVYLPFEMRQPSAEGESLN